MRRFSEKEKEYISRIYEATRNPRNSFLAVNLLYDYLLEKDACYITRTNYLKFDRKLDNVNSSEIIAIENHILELAMMLDYLEKNGLIMYVKDHTAKSNIFIGKVIEGGIDKITTPLVTEQLTKASSYRIVVGETLRDLVINNFKTSEDLALEAARQQSMLAQESLNEARLQSNSAIDALKESKGQTKLAQASLEESHKQTKNAEQTLLEAKEQTELAQKSLAEAKHQTNKAIESTDEARKQTKLAQESLSESQKQTQKATKALIEAQKQTKWANINTFIASLALFVSIITFCINRCSTQHVIIEECRSANRVSGMTSQPTKEKGTSVVNIKAKEPPVIQKVDKKTQGNRP
ncbi:MAG: hypothetical protein IJS06_03870 [Prevotella sp.]|nr:hypothetical protein [Prevotella sp.]